MSVRATCLAMLRLLLAALIMLVCAGPACAQDALDLSSVEVKFVLETGAVLDANGSLTEATRELLGLDPKYSTREVAYLETSSWDFFNEGWANRIRHKEGKKKLELLFKKRYAVEGTDVASALALAQEQGFGDEDGAWEAELDWGYTNMTLSISKEEKANFPDGVSTIEELGLEGSVRLAGEAMPALERDWRYEGWGREMLGSALSVGPLSYEKHTGSIEGIEVSVEVWPIPDREGGVLYLCELSFKTDTLDEAATDREVVRAFLEQNGILHHEDSLKTRAVLDAYLPAREEPQPVEPDDPHPEEPERPEEPVVPGGHEVPHTPVRPYVSEVPTASIRPNTPPVSMPTYAPNYLGGLRVPYEAVPAGTDATAKSEHNVSSYETTRQTELATSVEHPASVTSDAQPAVQQEGATQSVTYPVSEVVVTPVPVADVVVAEPLARTGDGSASCGGLAVAAALALTLAKLLRRCSRNERVS